MKKQADFLNLNEKEKDKRTNFRKLSNSNKYLMKGAFDERDFEYNENNDKENDELGKKIDELYKVILNKK